MKIRTSLKAILVLAGVLFFLMYPVSSKADTFTFFNITNTVNLDLSGQLSVDVTTSGSDVSFKFFNDVGIASSITDIYFDDGALLGISAINDSGAGVSFHFPDHPEVLPGGNNISPAFVTTTSFSAGSNPPTMPEGVNTSLEWVEIIFSLQTGKTFNDVISNLKDGGLRIGLHVQAIGPDSGSDSYVDTVQVPEPGILILLGIAMSAIGMASWRITKI